MPHEGRLTVGVLVLLLLLLLVAIAAALLTLGRRRHPVAGSKVGGEAARRPANAVVLLRRAVGRRGPEVYMVQEQRSGRYCFPGGIVDATDATPFAAAAREFREETGQPLPPARWARAFLWRGQTALFVGETERDLPAGPCASEDGEIAATSWVPLAQLRAAAFGQSKEADLPLRSCVVASTRALFAAGAL